MKFIKHLSDKEFRALFDLLKFSESYRIRFKAHTIILSYRKFSIDSIAIILNKNPETIRKWIAQWERLKMDSLVLTPKLGRPRKYQNN